MKCPLCSRGRLLGCRVIEVLLIAISNLKERLQVVLLHLLPDNLLQGLALKDLIGFLLCAQFNQERLVDALQSGHFGMLGWIG